MAEWDPILSPDVAAEYCGMVSEKTLSRMGWERAPLPGTGTENVRYGYRLSVLNRELDKLANIHGRTPAPRVMKLHPPADSVRKNLSRAVG